MNTSDQRRALLLQREPLVIGATWAKTWIVEMRREGRIVSGGWPGTLQEARARVRTFLDSELARRRMPPLSSEELAAATQATYQRAKRDWLDVARTFSPEGPRRRSRSKAPDPE